MSLNAEYFSAELDEPETVAAAGRKQACFLPDEDGSDDDDQASRTKRSFGGVCGTPTDEHKPSSRSRIKR